MKSTGRTRRIRHVHQLRRLTACSMLFAGALLPLGSEASSAQPFTLVDQWGVTGSGAGELTWPSGLEWHGGEIYVAEWTNARISVFDEQGQFLRLWGSRGTAAGEFDLPTAVAVNSAGEVFTAEASLMDRVQKFTDVGVFLNAWEGSGSPGGEFDGPRDVAIGDGILLVVDSNNDRIQEFDFGGNFVAAWTFDAAQFTFAPSEVAVAPTGEVYVLETLWNRVQRFAVDRTHIETVLTGGAGPGFLDGPSDLIIDGSGLLYVSEQTAKRVQKFSPTGEFLGQYLFPSGVCPAALALDDAGQVYVADDCGDRIFVLRDDAVGIFADGFEQGDTDAWSAQSP